MNGDDDFNKASNAYDRSDFALAFEMFLRAAEHGHVASMERVAIMYTCGEGVSCDYDKALEWEKRAIENGSVSALLNIGITFRVKGDVRNAREWFEKSLENGDGEAAMELAKLYMVSDKETETVKHYLEVAIGNERTCEDSKRYAQDLLAKYRE